MAIRILRLIEYTYETAEQASVDQARWTMAYTRKGFKMRSAVLPFEAVPWVEDDTVTKHIRQEDTASGA